jgi:transposase, IS5 family
MIAGLIYPLKVKSCSEIEVILVQAKGIDFTMKRRTAEKPLEELDKEHNRLISVLRSPGELPHAVIKRVFKAGRILVTTVKRVGVLMMFRAFSFNHLPASRSSQ